jgi:GH15 family glucan-1,4-alpha-glucosidase
MSTWEPGSLTERSIEIIESNQDVSGAYLASPNFAEYRYCWLRDASFIGYAMLRSGRPESTEAFLKWASGAIAAAQIDWRLLERAGENGSPVPPSAHLPTRFVVDGTPVGDEWPNFQIDGYGDWLWLLHRWLQTKEAREESGAAASPSLPGTSNIPEWAEPAVRKTVRYLSQTWWLPNYDAWEEHGDRQHPATLACVYGGLVAAERLGWADPRLAERVRRYTIDQGVLDGTFVKSFGEPGVDASLLWTAVPFELVNPEDSVMTRTVEEIERTLLVDGGVRRYAADTYYGGGRWILLTAWLGWYYAFVGRVEEAESCARWIEAQASPEGYLPEQVLDQVRDQAKLRMWRERWGEVAQPLLWSHAMYLVLVEELRLHTGVAGEE